MAQTSALYGWDYRDFAVVRVEFLLTCFNLSLTFILSLFKQRGPFIGQRQLTGSKKGFKIILEVGVTNIHVDIERKISFLLRIYLQGRLGILDLVRLIKWFRCKTSLKDMFAIMHYVQSVQLILDNQTLSNSKFALT